MSRASGPGRRYHRAVTYAPPQDLVSRGETPDGLHDLLHLPGFVPAGEADRLLDHCLTDLDWRRARLRMFGREVNEPRLTACHGDAGTEYRYSGVTRRSAGWTELLGRVARMTAERLRVPFNFVLANRYRDGRDGVGWHADDERGLGPVIASLSLGAARVFRVRRRRSGGPAVNLALGHGDLVLMWGRCQRDFEHSLPRTTVPTGERVNLTLRLVTSNRAGMSRTKPGRAA